MDLARGVFVTGTDTDVGKTVCAAAMVWALSADYWKPIQSGIEELPTGDSGVVRRLTGLSTFRIIPPVYNLHAPLSPDQAAELEGIEINPHHIVMPKRDRPIVVEGAGGVLVPLNDEYFMLDLMAQLGLPIVITCRTGLGTINHSLMTIETLKNCNLPIAGVVFNGDENDRNMSAIERLGDVKVIGRIPRYTALSANVLAGVAKTFDLSYDASPKGEVA